MTNRASRVFRTTRLLFLFVVCPLVLSGCPKLLCNFGVTDMCETEETEEAYAVTYSANGADSGSVPTDSNDYEEGQMVTVLSNTGNLARTGYSFAGWNTTADGNGTTYTSGNTFEIGSAHVTLYATWGRWSGIKQFGASFGDDTAEGVVVDSSGNVYVGGWTDGDLGERLPGDHSRGYGDIILTKYDASGTQQWIIQTGTLLGDFGLDVAVDSSGNVYVTGVTEGGLSVPTCRDWTGCGEHAGFYDPFLMKYDSSGTQQWVKQTGTSEYEKASSVAVDSSGNAYVTGYTSGDLSGTNAGDADVFLIKYDSSGTQEWIKQIGTSREDVAKGVAVDSSGNVYVTGFTEGSLSGTNVGDRDIFLMKYDASGAQQWIKQIGTSAVDAGSGVAADSSGNVYVTGWTLGALTGTNAGRRDIFLTKYDSSGTQQWMKQIGTSAAERGKHVAVDSSGNAYVTGWTRGALSGTNVGDHDIFLMKYDSSGTQQWINQIGTPVKDQGEGITVDAFDNVYVTGNTEGDLAGTNAGGTDIFLMKYDTSGNLQ